MSADDGILVYGDAFEYKDEGLAALISALKGQLPMAKVGIMGDKADRDADESGEILSNVDIGVKHEFGEDGMPIRSFLRKPIADKLQEYLIKAGAFEESAIRQIIDEKSLISFIKKFGIVGERIVADAFASGGFGEWPPSDMRFKKVQMTLVETQQLRNSITSGIEGNE